jgi:hypothetical protein
MNALTPSIIKFINRMSAEGDLPYSCSSHLMTRLTSFRNPKDLEPNLGQNFINRKIVPYIKIAMAGVGFGFVIPIACIESFIYMTFAILAIPLRCISDEPSFLSTILFDSSANSFIWAINNFFMNLFQSTLSTTEPSYAGMHEIRVRVRKNLLRQEIRVLWQQFQRFQQLLDQGQIQQRQGMDDGLKLLRKLLHGPENVSLRENLKNTMLPAAFILLSFVAVIECLNSNEPNLNFLCEPARVEIKALRENSNFKEKLVEFIIRNKKDFNLINFDSLEEKVIENVNDKEIFQKLKILSYQAIQGSILFADILAAYIQKE